MLKKEIAQDNNYFDFLSTFEALDYGDVHIKRCKETGLVAIIAIHNTKLGPSLGGVRCVPYPDFNTALKDALYLAKGMSYKAAVSNLPNGGGKAVIMAPPVIKDRKALFESFGRFIDELGGRYVTAEDSGVCLEDMNTIKSVTDYVTGYTNPKYTINEPSPFTSTGVRRGIEAAVKFKLGRDSLAGIHVAVKGVGKVGAGLCEQLHERGARLTIADINEEAIETMASKMPVTVVSTEEIHTTDCDVYAPCALSFTINDKMLQGLKAPIIAGAANNQLATPDMGEKLMNKGILYAPDYVINPGGLIHVSAQYAGSSEAEALQKVEAIYDTLIEVFDRAESQNLPTNVIADTIALERLA